MSVWKVVPAACAALVMGAMGVRAIAAPAPVAEPKALTAGGKFLPRDGKAIYENICANCHMQDGKGAEGAGLYPSLVANPKLAAPIYPVMVVTNGQKGMPYFGGMLDDAQVAAVVGYIRTHFGNDFKEPIAPDEVKAVRPGFRPDEGPPRTAG